MRGMKDAIFERLESPCAANFAFPAAKTARNTAKSRKNANL